MNSKSKGNITELEVMLAFAKLGHAVLSPYGNNERYDLIVDIEGKLLRIQCKSAHTNNNGASFVFDVRSVCHRKDGVEHRQYTTDEADYIATSFNGQCYLVPVGVSSSQVKLRLAPAKSGNRHGLRWAKDYELEKVVKSIKEGTGGK